jgi:hypothetical protein
VVILRASLAGWKNCCADGGTMNTRVIIKALGEA